jgi:hypothetical protein
MKEKKRREKWKERGEIGTRRETRKERKIKQKREERRESGVEVTGDNSR